MRRSQKDRNPSDAPDPLLRQLFLTLRAALDLLEEIALRPKQKAAPKPDDQITSRPTRTEIVSPNEKIAYSIRELQKLTGIGRSTIYAEIKMGRLRASKSGKRTLILAADLNAWIQSWN